MKPRQEQLDHMRAIRDAQKALAACPVIQPTEGSLRIWWIPQVPGDPFRFDVKSPSEGKAILDCLGFYDLFQLARHIKPDYSNAGGLEVFQDGEWTDWEDEEGNSIEDSNLVTP